MQVIMGTLANCDEGGNIFLHQSMIISEDVMFIACHVVVWASQQGGGLHRVEFVRDPEEPRIETIRKMSDLPLSTHTLALPGTRDP